MTRHPYYLRFLAILSALYICVHAAQLCAEINVSGDVTPADPSQWDTSTTVRIAQTSNGTVTIDSNSDVFSRYGFIGYTSGYTGEFTVDGAGSTWTNSSRIYAGYYGSGVLDITGGGVVNNDFGCLGYIAGSSGTAKVDGKDSKWTNNSDLYVGFWGNGTLEITGGGTVSNSSGIVGYDIYDQPVSIGTGLITVDGVNSKWTNNSILYVGLNGKGTVNISGGAAVAAPSVSINNQSLIAIDVGNGSQLSVNNGTGAITNGGTVRILAGANVASGIVYTPVSAGTWSGGGTFQPIGGKWNETDHTFTASFVQATFSTLTPITINLKDTQRVLVMWNSTQYGPGYDNLGVSFAPTTEDTSLTLSATKITGQILSDLQAVLDADNQTLLDGWQATTTGGYEDGDPAYLSIGVGPDISRNEINVWHYNGTAWSPYDATDLTCNGGYASFTVTGFGGYALTVPEPCTLMLLVLGLMSALVYVRRRLN